MRLGPDLLDLNHWLGGGAEPQGEMTRIFSSQLVDDAPSLTTWVPEIILQSPSLNIPVVICQTLNESQFQTGS